MTLNFHRTGTGEPLVLVHGIASRWEAWTPVLERLAAERDVIAIDLPGFANSPPPPPGTAPGAQSLTRLVAEFLDELDLERPHVAGFSLGGWITLELAKLGRARSATCLSPAGFHTAKEGRYQRRLFLVSVSVLRALRPALGPVMANPVTRTLSLGVFFGRPWRIPPRDAVLSVQGALDAPWFYETLDAITGPETFSGGEQIDVPVTIAWAEKDRVLLPRQAPRAARAVPGARSITLTGCGHVPTWDDPERVAQVLLQGSE